MGTGTGEYPAVAVVARFIPEPVPVFSQALRGQWEQPAARGGPLTSDLWVAGEARVSGIMVLIESHSSMADD